MHEKRRAPLSSDSPDHPVSRLTAWWTVGVLSFVAVLDWADRALISAIAEPVKQEFDLSDAQLGFAMGFAMVIMRVVIGVPIGRISDSWNRRNVLALSLGFWSLMTVATGMARNFTQFIAARLCVGGGTAGSYPPTLSMLGDLFPLKTRGLALGIWNIGGTIGFSIGLAVGALIAEHYGWRNAALSFGVVGIGAAALLFVIVKEPVRRDAVGAELADEKAPSSWTVLAFISRQRSLLHTIWGFILLNFVEGSQNYWTQSFYVRTHGMSIGEAGSALASVWLVAGIMGSVLGGYLLDRMGRRDIRWHAWLPGCAGLMCLVPSTVVYLGPSPAIALTGSFANTTIWSTWYAAQMILMTGLVGSRMRATAWALIMVITLMLGNALGPQVVGLISDWIEPTFGRYSLRFAMLSILVMNVWGALHFFLAGKTIADDYERAGRA
jgi:MFS family permease